MLIQETVRIPREFAQVKALVMPDPQATLIECFAAAYHDGEQSCLRCAPSCEPLPSGNKVWVDTGAAHPRGEGVVLPLHAWAVGATHFFPRLDADLEILPVGRESTQIRLMGRYDPPRGDATRGLDRMLLHDLAETSIRAFVTRLGERLQSAISILEKGDGTMKALVYHGPDQMAWEDVAKPAMSADTDAIVRVDATTICGTDLHILRGDVPKVTDGRILGHEAVGTVESVGSAVKTLHPGDRVLVSCITACGSCRFCREGRYGQCLGGGGWILGHMVDGTQAEFVRVPFADTSTHLVPPGVGDEEVLMLADILPTSYEVGVLNGQVAPGDVVAIVGAGPIGLAAVMTANLLTPGHIVAVDLADGRLEAAQRLGADVVVNSGREDPLAVVRRLTGGLGADVAIEAVGMPETFELATELVRPGGHVANIGVHGQPATLHLERLWIRDVTITTGLVDTFHTPTLIRLLTCGKLNPSALVTQRFALSDIMAAYDTFAHAANTGALKVVLTPTGPGVNREMQVPAVVTA